MLQDGTSRIALMSAKLGQSSTNFEAVIASIQLRNKNLSPNQWIFHVTENKEFAPLTIGLAFPKLFRNVSDQGVLSPTVQ
jgi:hypothetical protein